MKSIELSNEAHARLMAAAEAEGVSPAQWIANLLIKAGRLPPGYQVDSAPAEQAEQAEDDVPQ